MEFGPTEEQVALAEAVDGLVARRAQTTNPRAALDTAPGYDETLWRTLCDQIGAAALAIPEEYGGAGFTLAETHVVLERLGAKLVPSPLLGSAVLAAQALLATGNQEACARLLPSVAAGTTIAALAWADPAGHWNPTAPAVSATPLETAALTTGTRTIPPGTAPTTGTRTIPLGTAPATARAEAAPARGDTASAPAPAAAGLGSPAIEPRAGAPAAPVEVGAGGEHWRLSGAAALVIDGVDAEVVLVAASTPDGVGLFEVHGPVTRERTPALDPTLRFATLTFEHTPATALTLDAEPVLRHVADRAAVAITALQIGAAHECLQRTVEHLRTRVQFGRPLGSFQALKHRVADLFVAVESARSMSWAAANCDRAELPLRAALAKAWCSDAYQHVAAETIQLHGGIAITWEHDAHLYFKRAHATAQLFGAAREHRRRLLAHV